MPVCSDRAPGPRVLPALLALLAVLLAGAPRAQVSVYAYTDKTEMGEAETLAYTLEITGDLSDLQPVSPPDARGLVLARSTPVLQSTLIVNGQERQTIRWLYAPQRTGSATILGTRIEAGGRTLRTDPIEVEVVPQAQRSPRASRMAPMPAVPPAAQPPPSAAGDLLIRAEPRTRRVVVGEQVVVDYVLYYAPGLRPHGSPQLATALNTDGFWRETLDLDAADLFPRDVSLGGEPYKAATVFRLALFPTRTGSLDLAPVDFEVALVRTQRDTNPFAPLFSPFTSRFVEERIRAPGVAIAVDPLPDGAPASFSGAVGRFGMAAYTDQDAVAAGEPVALTVEIRGAGNIATLAAPALPAMTGVDVFDPQEERQIDRSTLPLAGTKTFTYTLVPRGGGALTIPPVEWSYFDPDAGTYETLRSASFPLEVSGAPLATRPDGAVVDPSVPLGLIVEADWRRAVEGPALPLGVVLGGIGLPVLALLGLVAVRRRKDRAADRSPAQRALRAHPEAARRLQAARTADAPRAVYAALEAAVRPFLAERLGLPSAHLPRRALAEALARHGVAPATCRDLDALLAEAERAQFAPPGALPAAAGDVTDRAERLLAAIDAEARPVPA